ncbi:putative phosphothreonine lyase domain-containing protein [Streptomyces chartreusis]|uniref:putative phosphothreonine lyase domain-containing protein n=1 Tax=Streptomyces chartreusis TaxID=1969 RepID=UPI003828C6C9
MTCKNAPTEQQTLHSPATCMHEPWVWADHPHDDPDCERLWSGKWLWFPPLRLLDDSWNTIRTATHDGVLGYRSKAATLINTRPGSDDTRRPICIYTNDWRDLEDVKRVLNALRDLGNVDVLLYKTDSETRRQRYGQGASTYKALPGRRSMTVPRRTTLLLEHHHTARQHARKAAEQRKRLRTKAPAPAT